MIKKDLDTRFLKAVEIASKMTQASGTLSYNHSESYDLRNAFKTNAWIQISHLSIDEAKEQYIEIINSLLEK